MKRTTTMALLALIALATGGVIVYGALNAPSAHEAATEGLKTTSNGHITPELTKGFRPFKAPAIKSHRLETGAAFNLASLRGHPVFVNFWASYCGGCQVEAKQLQRFAASLHGQATLVGVDTTDQTSPALAFARKVGMTYPLVADHSGQLAYDYGVVGMPTTIVIDARGVVVDKIVGATTADVLHAKLIAASRA